MHRRSPGTSKYTSRRFESVGIIFQRFNKRMLVAKSYFHFGCSQPFLCDDVVDCLLFIHWLFSCVVVRVF